MRPRESGADRNSRPISLEWERLRDSSFKATERFACGLNTRQGLAHGSPLWDRRWPPPNRGVSQATGDPAAPRLIVNTPAIILLVARTMNASTGSFSSLNTQGLS
jgi:hypothetical protein